MRAGAALLVHRGVVGADAYLQDAEALTLQNIDYESVYFTNAY